MTDYDVPAEIQVEADGPIRVIRLNRPDDLNATNHVAADLLAGAKAIEGNAGAIVSALTNAEQSRAA